MNKERSSERKSAWWLGFKVRWQYFVAGSFLIRLRRSEGLVLGTESLSEVR